MKHIKSDFDPIAWMMYTLLYDDVLFYNIQTHKAKFVCFSIYQEVP